MSIDQAIREVIAEEVERILGPVQQQLEVLSRLAAAMGAPLPVLKRGAPARAAVRGGGRRKGGGRVDNAGRQCAIIGCGKPSRSKGYCAAHYQKYRNLERTGRLPAEWKADAAPNSVRNLQLPRGRAGAQAIAEARKK